MSMWTNSLEVYMFRGRGRSDEPVGVAVQLFLALVRAEPEWREVTLDRGGAHLGGHVSGGSPERLSGGNDLTAEEAGLPSGMFQGFLLHEGPAGPWSRLHRIRHLRSVAATERIARGDEPEEREAVVWGDELERARTLAPSDDEVAPAVALLEDLLGAVVGPWELAQVVRGAGGGLWAYVVDLSGDVIVASHDVEARRAGDPPTRLWLPVEGQTALRRFLDLDADAWATP